MRASPRARELAAAGLFYALAAAVFTWPLAERLNSGLPDLWDAKLNAWILNWDFHQTFRDPLHLFDANIFYPARYALAFSENLYGAALFGFPLYAFGASTLFVYNVLFLLGMWLSAMAAWALAREATHDALAASIAGIVYAFVPWRLAQLPHIQFQWGAFLALALLFLLRYLEGGRRRDAVLFSVCFGWNALCNVHYAIFSGLLVALVAGHETLVGGWKAMRGRVLGAGMAVAAAAAAVLPFYIPYQLASNLYGMRRGWGEIETFSGRPIDFLTAGPQNKLYAPWTQKLAQPEGDFFPGISVLVLGVIAAVLLWTRRPEPSARGGALESPGRRRAVRGLDAAVGLLLLLWLAATLKTNLSIGPLHLHDPGRILVLATMPFLLRLALAFPRGTRFADLGDFLRRRWRDPHAPLYVLILALGAVVALGVHTPYYRFLALSFGAIFRAIRVPSRGIVLFDLALGVLAAWGLALITRRLPRAGRLAAVAAAIAAAGFEYRAFPIEIGDVSPEPPPVYRWLATAPFSGAVVHWPLATDPDVEHTFRSTAHWKPIVNGYSGFGPPAYRELMELLAHRPIAPGIWDRLQEDGASVLVFHPREFEDANARLAYVRALKDGIRTGKVVPLRGFGAEPARDFAFRLAGATPFDAGLPDGAGPAAAEDVERELSYFESLLHAPFGLVDSPGEGATVAPGAWGYGWALDDSGIREVRMSVDGKPAPNALYGSARPGPGEVYPAFPDATKAGFGFGVPALPPGPHVLVFTLVAKDGGTSQIVRHIVVR